MRILTDMATGDERVVTAKLPVDLVARLEMVALKKAQARAKD